MLLPMLHASIVLIYIILSGTLLVFPRLIRVMTTRHSFDGDDAVKIACHMFCEHVLRAKRRYIFNFSLE